MIRHVSRIRVRPRRKERPAPLPVQTPITAALAADHVALKAQLHEEAARTVCSALERMLQREQETARSTPELEPYLTAYFEVSRRSLLQHTLAILDEHAVHDASRPQRHEQPPRRRVPFRRLIPVRIPVRSRKEQPDGAA